MLSKMKECGIEEEQAMEMIKERIQKYEKACQTYKKNNKWINLNNDSYYNVISKS